MRGYEGQNRALGLAGLPLDFDLVLALRGATGS
jgi:hypothetical protein